MKVGLKYRALFLDLVVSDGVPAGDKIAVQRVQLPHQVVWDGKVHHVRVLSLALGDHRLWQHDKALLKGPPECWGAVIVFRWKAGTAYLIH